MWYYRKQKEIINKLEARVAVLRMLLRAKLKRKGSQIQDQYKEEREFLDSVMSKLELLGTYSLSRSSDYADVLGLLTSISEAIDMHTVQKTPAFYMAHQESLAKQKESLLKISGVESDKDGKDKNISTSGEKQDVNALPEFDRWAQLLKYDKGNLYIIKEIIETTKDLKNRIEIYNAEQVNKELLIRVPELIYLDGFEGLQKIVDLDLKKTKLGKADKKSKRQKDLRGPVDTGGSDGPNDPGDSTAA